MIPNDINWWTCYGSKQKYYSSPSKSLLIKVDLLTLFLNCMPANWLERSPRNLEANISAAKTYKSVNNFFQKWKTHKAKYLIFDVLQFFFSSYMENYSHVFKIRQVRSRLEDNSDSENWTPTLLLSTINRAKKRFKECRKMESTQGGFQTSLQMRL